MSFKLKRKILSWMLAVALCVTTAFTGQIVYAQDTEESITAEDLGQITEESADSWRYDNGMMSEEALDYNAQLGSTMEDQETAPVKGVGDLGYGETSDKSWSYKYNGKTVTSKGGYLRGIDVSYWQHDIDWTKVKKVVDNGGLDFVIIRCGWGNNSTSRDDSKFARNVAACESKNIPYGVYLYSYATSLSDAKSEANHTLRLLEGHHPNFPVYYDLEDNSIRKATGGSKDKITGFAEKYCSMLTNEGYKAGVYANLNWFSKYIDGKKLKNEGYDLWLAQWIISGSRNYTELGHGSRYSIWQCCSYGTVSGISGRVDLNLLVRPHSEIEGFMADSIPSTLKISTPDKTTGYINTDSAVTKYGPGIGYKPASTSYEFAEQVDIVGMVGKYYELSDKEGNVNLWINKAWVSAATEAKEIKTAEDDDGNTYYYAEAFDGSIIKSAWSTVGGKKYYSDDTGKLVTGLVQIGNYKYGFSSSCVMYKSTAHWFGCTKYRFDSKGRAYQKKATMKKKASYRSGPGTDYSKKGTYKKGKTVYIIRKSGSWSQMTNGYWVKTSTTKAKVLYPVYKPEIEVSYKAVITEKYTSRSGPKTSYLKKKTYKKGAEVTVSGTYDDWAKLTSGYWVPISKLEKK